MYILDCFQRDVCNISWREQINKHLIMSVKCLHRDGFIENKLKTKIKYNTVGIVPKSNRKRQNKDTTNTQIHDCSISWLGTDT